jgi:hypothetical protein
MSLGDIMNIFSKIKELFNINKIKPPEEVKTELPEVKSDLTELPDEAKLIALKMYSNHISDLTSDKVETETREFFNEVVKKAEEDKNFLNSVVKSTKNIDYIINKISYEFNIDLSSLKNDIIKIMDFKDKEVQKASTEDLEDSDKKPLNMSDPDDFKKLVELQYKNRSLTITEADFNKVEVSSKDLLDNK